MKIEIVNKSGNLITDFELESNPFTVGETIIISVSNHDKKFWNVEEARGEYKINKIEHFLRKDYNPSQEKGMMMTTMIQTTKQL